MAAGALFLALPSGGVVQGLVFVAVNGAATTALGVGITRNRLDGRPWRVLLAAGVAYCAGVAVWYLYPVGLGGALPYPSALDPLFWLTYLGWAAFLFGLSVRRASADRGVLLDGLVGAAALAIVAWPLFLEPVVDTPELSLRVRVASITYPLLLLLVASVGIRVALLASRISVVEVLLAAWLVLELAGDVWYSLAGADGTFRYGHPWFVAWLASYTALGALALHPGARRLDQPDPEERLASPTVRAVVLGAFLSAAVATIALRDGRDADTYAMAAGCLAMVVLVVLRLAATSRDLRSERELRKELERASTALQHAATHDPLTGLANRAAFDAFLPRAIAERRRPGRSAAVALLDIDSFKAVNDTYGHAAGDALLRVTAERLAGLVRPSDLVARIGGDEFAAVVADGDVRTALELGERIKDALTEPAVLGSTVVVPSVSIGLHAPDAGDDAQEVLLCADAALYSAKAAGGGVELFDAARHRRFIERHRLEAELRAAPGGGQLVLHYQPVVELATRRVVGAEALVRWHHPVRGFLNPGAFIEVAEESGAIIEVGRWVLRQGCADARTWQAQPGAAGVGVAVNLSRLQLRSPTVVEDVRDALDVSGLPPGLLTLEVTETALMADTGGMVDALDKIKALGVELAMDDFGTGYSSLAHLRRLPIDVLKIDKAFVDGIASDEEEWALASAIVRLATSLGKRTLAEGIERAAQLAHLRTLGCELGQGWLFARAMPLADLLGWIDGQGQP